MAQPSRRPESVPVSPAVWQLLHLLNDVLDEVLLAWQKGGPTDRAAPAQSAVIRMLGGRLQTTTREALLALRRSFNLWLATAPKEGTAEGAALSRQVEQWVRGAAPAAGLSRG